MRLKLFNLFRDDEREVNREATIGCKWSIEREIRDTKEAAVLSASISAGCQVVLFGMWLGDRSW